VERKLVKRSLKRFQQAMEMLEEFSRTHMDPGNSGILPIRWHTTSGSGWRRFSPHPAAERARAVYYNLLSQTFWVKNGP